MSPPSIALGNRRETAMSKLHMSIRSHRSAGTSYLLLACLCLLLAVTLTAQAPASGAKTVIVRQLADVKFPARDGPNCLQFVRERGDHNTRPSTPLLKTCTTC